MKTISAEAFNQQYGREGATLFQNPATPKTFEPSLWQRVSTDIQNRGQSIAATLETPSASPSQTLALSTKATATAFGGITNTIAEAVKSLPGGKEALDAIGGVASGAFKGLTDRLAETKLFKEAAAGLEPNNTLENTLSTLSSGGEIAGNILAAEGGARVAQKVVDTTKRGITNLVDNARPTTRALYDRSQEIIKPSPSPAKAAGEVLQAKKPLTARDVETFRNIDTEGVKTYADLEGRIKTSIGRLSQEVDEHLAKDPTPLTLDRLVTRSTSGSGRVVERNFVQTAIQHLKELYEKTADDVALADIDDLFAKAQTNGLTRLEVNDISRLYNSEFGSKAFSKVTGEPLTSVNAQAYENIRKGLKDVARQSMGGAEAAAADKIISSLYNTKDLISKNVSAVQKLQQKIAERGLLEKLGNTVAKYGDLLTGGSLRGLIGGLLPRGAGYKIMNALDLEERLAKNLEIIRKALESGSDDAIITATKELTNSQ